jgi:hypothetical protein
MRITLLLTIIIFLTSCGSSDKGVSKQISGSDSLVINFTAPQSDSVIKSVTTADKKAIDKITRFVDGKEAEEFKCGYNGSLLFFSKEKLLSEVNFNYTEAGCSHFLLSIDRKLVSTVMSNEAIDFLKSLAEGKDWY